MPQGQATAQACPPRRCILSQHCPDGSDPAISPPPPPTAPNLSIHLIASPTICLPAALMLAQLGDEEAAMKEMETVAR